jgi:hypothetical protein
MYRKMVLSGVITRYTLVDEHWNLALLEQRVFYMADILYSGFAPVAAKETASCPRTAK